MIDRGNWKLLKKYLKYREEIDQISPRSIRLEETWLRHVIEWAGNIPFRNAPKIRPAFPVYMLTARVDEKEGRLSPEYIKKVIMCSRRFLFWISIHIQGNKNITGQFLDTLKTPRMTIEPKEHEAVTFEEIQEIAVAPVYATREKRIRAAAIFLWLSGIRIGAFVTLPIAAVDLENLEIKQWPGLGVKTKNGKHATTYLLNIPELLEVVREWDYEVREKLPDNGFWFAPLLPDSGKIDPNIFNIGNNRYRRARKDLYDWLTKVGLPYHSPHKFRHGYAVYALKQADDIGDLKAISQNLMHSDLKITDGIYGILDGNDVRERIINLLDKKNNDSQIHDIKNEDMYKLFLEFINFLNTKSRNSQ